MVGQAEAAWRVPGLELAQGTGWVAEEQTQGGFWP